LGVSAAALEVPAVRSGMTIFGIAFLIYFGCATWIKRAEDEPDEKSDEEPRPQSSEA